MHLINRDYREQEDRVEEKREFRLAQPRNCWATARQREVLLAECDPQTLAWEPTPDGIVITVPTLEYWNVLKVSFADQD